MMALKMAYRNLVGAGLRTWLNVIVLSMAFVMIIWHKGILDGWDRQAKHDTIEWEIAGGQFWHKAYDPYDVFTIADSHGKIPSELNEGLSNGTHSPVLYSQATIYPEERMQTVLLKGIDPNQKLIQIPTHKLNIEIEEVPVVIGTRMAKANKLNIDDVFTVRWRDVNGTFDAAEVRVMGLFRCNVPAVDMGQLWLPIERLQSMMQAPNEATIIIADNNHTEQTNISGWEFKDQKFLLSEIEEMIKMKSIGGAIFYLILMTLALLAIFDTQVLSIFRRRKEIGTYIALGMTRSQVVRLFTVEGAMHAILAIIVGALYGIPFLTYMAKVGFAMPANADDIGMTIADTIYPYYGVKLVIGTILLVLVSVTIVSYFPSKKISKLNPTDAIKGKMS